jgi:hypothetical protein
MIWQLHFLLLLQEQFWLRCCWVIFVDASGPGMLLNHQRSTHAMVNSRMAMETRTKAALFLSSLAGTAVTLLAECWDMDWMVCQQKGYASPCTGSGIDYTKKVLTADCEVPFLLPDCGTECDEWGELYDYACEAPCTIYHYNNALCSGSVIRAEQNMSFIALCGPTDFCANSTCD